ncbi:hypothetical protein GCM10025878_09930 [Leuconostoc gasicomitatum]|uniref:Uncharacterized protein n=1 Tax=Leuconostoc inhae TaxID=178001 RepID=A0AAN2QV41_9LACO|nr:MULTISPECIES: hypothetical protein [Leuconostoc]MBZ5966888.1 hypothetical protein [Leuconostoc gasicomitatum]MBZ5980108.1 hypothetical protein [Leuconostoc gasicomitatum]MBZ5981797.1 hypothetical protein [Leuconostoc gasicomitatum]MBZ5995222.1 hypothetical protein [Leuconostoc gasicomitatum]CBL91480.1 hypothetical protein LEGAS_0832 [Leuconostoc gasicomitatum LMG 18811]
MNYDDQLIKKIKERFIKKINTLYWVCIVYQKYSKKINVYFQFSKIDTAIHSGQIAKYDEQYKERMAGLSKRIKHETKPTRN